MSAPGVRPASSIASTSSCTASSLEPRSGANPPSSPTAVVRPRSCEDPLERVVGLGAPPQRLGEAGRPERHDHELLEVDVVVGVGAAVEHVHHRRRQHVGVGAADVAEQRQAPLVGRGVGDGEGHAEDGVGAEAGLVVGAVEIEQDLVDAALVGGLEAEEGVGDLAVDVCRRRRARPCHRSGRHRRGARPPRTGRCRRRTGRWPGRSRRTRARPRPRPSGCRGSRGPHGPRCARCCSWPDPRMACGGCVATAVTAVAVWRTLPLGNRSGETALLLTSEPAVAPGDRTDRKS